MLGIRNASRHFSRQVTLNVILNVLHIYNGFLPIKNVNTYGKTCFVSIAVNRVSVQLIGRDNSYF